MDPLMKRYRLRAFALMGTLIGTTLMGCQSSYYLHLAKGQVDLWWRRQSVTDALKDNQLTSLEKRRIELVLAAKKFSETEFGLTPGT